MVLDLSPSAADVAAILRERRWLPPDRAPEADPALQAWFARAAELLAPHAPERAALTDLLSLVFSYDAPVILKQTASQDVLARSGARNVIRELAHRVLDADADLDSDRFKEIIDGIKSAVPYRSREMFHPIRLALAGRAGEGVLDRVILLLDSAARLNFTPPVKPARQRILEFCAALD